MRLVYVVITLLSMILLLDMRRYCKQEARAVRDDWKWLVWSFLQIVTDVGVVLSGLFFVALVF